MGAFCHENYFTRAPGRNYVSFLSPEISRTDLYRVRFYYPLQRYNIRKPAVRRTLRNLSAALQLGFGVDRTRRRPDGFVFQKGAQWFSITHALAQYLLEKESEIRPYTFTDGDLDELLAAPETALFARKFDYRTSPGVVDALFDRFG